MWQQGHICSTGGIPGCGPKLVHVRFYCKTSGPLWGQGLKEVLRLLVQELAFCWFQPTEKRDTNKNCCHALYQTVSTAAWGFQMLASKWKIFMPKEEDAFCKKTFASSKSLTEKYSGLFLLVDAKTHSWIDQTWRSHLQYPIPISHPDQISHVPSAISSTVPTWSLCYQSWGKDGANYQDS